MEFKRCQRCGSFYASNNDICYNCQIKDSYEISKLKNYFEENQNIESIEELSSYTGISVKNLNRFMNNGEFNNISYLDNNK